MSYKLKDIFLESDAKNSELSIDEGLFSDLFGAIKDIAKGAVHGFVSRKEAAKIDKMIGVLKKLQDYGIRQIRGNNLDLLIRDLEREKRILFNKKPEKQSGASRDIRALLKALSPKKSTTRKRGRLPLQMANKLPTNLPTYPNVQMHAENKYKLKDVFANDFLLEFPDGGVQKDDNIEYNAINRPDEPKKEPSQKEDEEIETPILTDEEILSGLRDDVAVYGEFDPALGDKNE